jgi:hypothetical protein
MKPNMSGAAITSRRSGVIAAQISWNCCLQGIFAPESRLLRSSGLVTLNGTTGFDASKYGGKHRCTAANFSCGTHAPTRSVFAQAQRIARDP